MAPRTVGLPIFLFYPILSVILLGIAAFSSAEGVWYTSIQTANLVVRFAGQDYCGYNVTNLVITSKIGCIQRGWEYQLPQGYFGVNLPTEINNSISRVSVLTVVAFALVFISGAHHAYTIRYSYRVNPAPNSDKLWSLMQIHFGSVLICFAFTWITFIAVAAIVSRATSYSNDPIAGQPGIEVIGTGVGVYWGQSPWLVLGAAIVQFGWVWEAVRWRVTLM